MNVSSSILETEELDNEKIFREKLPDNCPPSSSTPVQKETFLRIVNVEHATEILSEHFDSQAKRGIPIKPYSDPCRHAACSFFKDTKKGRIAIDAILKFPIHKKKPFVALVELADDDGLKAKPNKKKHHINIWLYDCSNPENKVKEVIHKSEL